VRGRERGRGREREREREGGRSGEGVLLDLVCEFSFSMLVFVSALRPCLGPCHGMACSFVDSR